MKSLNSGIGLLLILIIRITSVKAITTCYFGSWAPYRPGDGKFEIEDIDVNLCDYVIYSFIGLNPDGTIKILRPNLDINKRGFERFTNLKIKNEKLKTLVAIGGWSEGSITFSRVCANTTLRGIFVENAVDFVNKYKFDGMDIDWEYPSKRGGSPSDKENFSDLCKEMRAAFNNSKLILTAAVSSDPDDVSYDITSLSTSLHYIHVMTYNFHRPFHGYTGENAPLYPSPSDRTRFQNTINVNATIRAWLRKGADPKKVILGLATYGITYTLASPTANDIGAPAKGPGVEGPFTKEKGVLAYNEICSNLKQTGWTKRWSNEQKVPYLFKGDQWVGYDDIESIGIKVEFGKSLGLGGAMIWAIENDDFRGSCGPEYPLLTTIKDKNP